MKRLNILIIFTILISFGLVSWHYISKRSLNKAPEKATLVMDQNLKSTTVLIIK